MGIIAYILLAGLLVAATVTDLRTGRIPNRLTYTAIVVGLLLWPIGLGLLHGPAGLLDGLLLALTGLACGLLPFAMIFALGGLGGGDVKLMAAVGALSASWQVVFHTTVLAMIFMMLMALAVMVQRGIVRRTLGRLLSAVLSLAARTSPQAEFADSPRLPFALAACVGGLLAGLPGLLHIGQIPIA